MPWNSHLAGPESDTLATSVLTSLTVQGSLYALRYLKQPQNVVFFVCLFFFFPSLAN